MSYHQLVCTRCGAVENRQSIYEALIEPQGPCDECKSKRFTEEVIYVV